MKQYRFLLIILAVTLMSCTKNEQSAFTIFVDEKSYSEAQIEINAYANSIESEGLKTFIVVDKWHNPDSIRSFLQKQYLSEKYHLEGAVFIGDIPVPMIRGAQHMATAFKMDEEKYPMHRSSVPSDRFYEDFDLKFELIKQDEKDSLLFYYKLLPESSQTLSPEIYSGRIKPNKSEAKYEVLKDYLKKVVEYKKNPLLVDQILLFTGHGYNSESPLSWMDEKITLNQQFNYLRSQKNLIEYVNFKYDTHIKFRLLSELKRNNLDLAFLHNHGGVTAQYLSGTPENKSNQVAIESVKYYLRSKLRSAKKRNKNLQQVKQDYHKRMEIPVEWFKGALDPEQTKKDSTFNANLDIYMEDLEDYSSNARFIQFDACFNGAFQKDRYISSEYIFDAGKTITVQANSVNVLQDNWPGEMVGLLGLGLRVGNWHKMSCALETHLIGDPTLSFVSPDKNLKLNKLITARKNDVNFWEKQLDSKYADMQALAIRMIFMNKGSKMSGKYLQLFKKSPDNSVRTEAFKILSFCNDDNFIEAINLGINDSYELIQRLSASYMLKTGNQSHIPHLIDGLLQNNKGRRVLYHLKEAVGMYNSELLLEELDKQISEKEYLLNPKEKKADVQNIIEKGTGRMARYVEELKSNKTSKKEKFNNIRAFRNKPIHTHIDEIISFIDTVKSERIKISGIEMLGWFNYSSQRKKIDRFCGKIIENSNSSESCTFEAQKTKKRIN